MSLPFLTIRTIGILTVIEPVMLRLDTWFHNISDVVFKHHILLTRLIGKNHVVHMYGLEQAQMANWSWDRAVHMYSLGQVQLVSRPWDRFKIQPGHLLSTDRGNIVKRWYDPGNRILTFGCLSKVLIASMTESCDLWTKDSIASIAGIYDIWTKILIASMTESWDL